MMIYNAKGTEESINPILVEYKLIVIQGLTPLYGESMRNCLECKFHLVFTKNTQLATNLELSEAEEEGEMETLAELQAQLRRVLSIDPETAEEVEEQAELIDELEEEILSRGFAIAKEENDRAWAESYWRK